MDNGVAVKTSSRSAGHMWRPARKYLFVVLLAAAVIGNAFEAGRRLVLASDRDALVAQAKQFVQATYSGDFRGAAALAAGQLRDELLAGTAQGLMPAAGTALQDMTLSAFIVQGKDIRMVVLEVHETPFSTVLFKEITFRRVGQRWLIISVGLDA